MIEKNPKISCILSSYNKPDLLVDAVESVLNQTYQDFELIIVDGGLAIPKLKKVLEKYSKHPKIKVIYTGETEEDRKRKIMHSVANNMGIEITRGEYITYLCDDDIYYPTRFKKMLNKFKSNPSASVVYCWWRECNMDETGRKWNRHIRKPEGVRRRVDRIVDGIAFMHKKDCLKKLKKPYWPEKEKNEQWHYDGLFAAKLAKHFLFYPVNEVLYEHRYTSLHTNYGYKSLWKIYGQYIFGLLGNDRYKIKPEF